jgi:UDP-glucose 4-epimerase
MANPRRILVLGASGFIGGTFARMMAEAGHPVLGVGRHPAEPGSESYRQSAFDPESLLKIIEEFQPELCLNAAGSGKPFASFADPAGDFAANTLIVQHVLEALRKGAPSCRYIGLSSAAVYGSNPELPWKESARGYPSSPYGYHKLGAELLGEEYARLYNMKVLTLRAFSVYGPGLRRQLFWDTYCRARGASELKLYGTGKETRDFIYIDDAVAGIAWFAEHAAFEGGVLNLASGVPTLISEACEILFKSMGWSGHHQFTGDQFAGAPLRMEADVTLASAMGFHCQVSLAEGLRRTAAWLKTTNPDAQA